MGLLRACCTCITYPSRRNFSLRRSAALRAPVFSLREVKEVRAARPAIKHPCKIDNTREERRAPSGRECGLEEESRE